MFNSRNWIVFPFSIAYDHKRGCFHFSWSSGTYLFASFWPCRRWLAADWPRRRCQGYTSSCRRGRRGRTSSGCWRCGCLCYAWPSRSCDASPPRSPPSRCIYSDYPANPGIHHAPGSVYTSNIKHSYISSKFTMQIFWEKKIHFKSALEHKMCCLYDIQNTKK